MSLFTNLLKKSLKDFYHKRKKLLFTVVAIFFVLIGINYILSRYVDRVVGELIREFVHEKSNGFYQVDFDDIAYILNNGRFLMTNFDFDIHPDHKENINYNNLDHNYIYQASIPNLHIDIIDFWSIFVKRKLRVIGVEVNSPAVKILNLNKSKAPKKISFEAGNLYKVLSSHLEELKINDFAINDGTFDFETYEGADYDNFYIKGLTFKVENFQVNESSSERSDKFFYTDDIFLEVTDQELLLKDSLHKVAFEKFYLSTKNNHLGFEKLKLTRREDPRADQLEHDHYEVTIPDIRFEGIDFLSAYNDNFLFIDTINILNPEINLIKRVSKKQHASDRNNFLDIAMMYHDYLEINHFNLNDALLSFADETQEQPKNYSIDQITVQVTDVKIDTGQNSVRSYGFDFDKVDLMIQDYETTLPDSANTLKFSELNITSNPFVISLKDLSLQPDPNNTRKDKSQVFANIPYLVLTGFDLSKAINRDTFDIDELYLEQPEIRLVSTQQNSSINRSDSISIVSKLTKNISEFTRYFNLHHFLVKEGNFQLESSDGQTLKKLKMSEIDLSVRNVEVDKFSFDDNQFLSRIELDLRLGESKLISQNSEFNLESVHLSSQTKQIKFDSIHFSNGSSSSDNHLTLIIPDIEITGIDLGKVLQDHHLDIDTLMISNANAIIEKSGVKTDRSVPVKRVKSNLPTIRINHLINKNQNLTYKKDNTPVFVGIGGDFNIEGLILDQSLDEKPINQFDYERINLISIEKYYFLLSEQKHFFNTRNILWKDNSNFSMEDISLTPFDQPNNQYSINIPMISMKGIDLKRILKQSYYSGDEILIERPIINLKLMQGKQEKMTSLDLGFIPLLLRNKFLGIQSNTFKVNQGVIKVHQMMDNDSLILVCDNFDIAIEEFEVDSTTEMVPDKFLFANDVKFAGDYLTLQHQKKGDFLNVNHINISTREKDLKFEGIYFSSNTSAAPEDGKTKITVDFLNLIDLDFFSLTQHRSLHLAELNIDNANISITPVAKESMKERIKITNDGLPSDTVLMDNLKKALDGDKIFDPDQNKAKKRNRKGLNIHEKGYLFDTLLLKQVDIEKIFITDSKFSLENPIEHRKDLNIPDIWVLTEGLKYNPSLAQDTSRIFYSDHILTRLSNLEYVLPDNLSAVKLSELYLNSTDSTVLIKNFTLDPRVSKFDFGKIKGYQSTWLKIENDSIFIDKMDFLSIINDRTLRAENIDINTLNFEIYRDKRIPFPEWQRRPLPQVELHNIDFTIQIDTVNLNQSYIGYQEHAEKSNTPGEIFFRNLNAMVINISNDSIHLLSNPKTNISATASVFGKGKIEAEFQFDMIDPENIHTYGVQVDSFDLTEFNRILIPNASAQVKSGSNEKIIMTARANENYSYGEMRFYYNDLKVQLLNRETETPKGLGNVLGSFFANTFIIRTNNPKNFVLRKGDIFFERDKKRAIFNYWTKTFLSGVVSSIGAVNNKKKIKKMQEENLKKIEEQNTENATLYK